MNFTTLAFNGLSDALAASAAEVVREVQRSLVALHNGRHGVGAGMIWRKDAEGAFILTNNHVVAQGRSLRASLENGAVFPARLIAEDVEVDLALLYIETQDPPTITLADSRDLHVGQYVLAIGHPWGQRGVVTAGLISSLSKAHTRGPRGEIEIIRSDARLAPGNSGGPLVNAWGAVIGVNTLIIGGDQGIALPSHIADEFVNLALSQPTSKGD